MADKIFIDTNIFLDFYRTDADSLQILRELKEKHLKRLFFPEQVYIEFRRNRTTQISAYNKTLEFPKKLPSFLHGASEYEQLSNSFNEFTEKIKSLKSYIINIIDNPDEDPIYREIKNLYESRKIPTSKEDIENAIKRKYIGGPPISSKKNTIGDEIIWESILSNVRDNLVVVSRDNTFTDNLDLLKDEFNQKTQRNLLGVTKKINEAIKLLGEEPSHELVELEAAQVKSLPSDVLRFSPLLAGNAIMPTTPVFATTPVSTSMNFAGGPRCTVCGSRGPWNGARCMACGEMNDD